MAANAIGTATREPADAERSVVREACVMRALAV
jgi:hypothetical protein